MRARQWELRRTVERSGATVLSLHREQHPDGEHGEAEHDEEDEEEDEVHGRRGRARKLVADGVYGGGGDRAAPRTSAARWSSATTSASPSLQLAGQGLIPRILASR